MPEAQHPRRSVQGRVLRVKRGYNPNSSSVGSEIPQFIASALGAGICAVTVLHALDEVRKWIRERRSNAEHVGRTPPEEQEAS